MIPDSMVSSTAFSRVSVKSMSRLFPSNSPLFRSAPAQAKIRATELVDVFFQAEDGIRDKGM